MPGVVRLNDLCTGHTCVLGDTLIKLMNGTSKPIQDLINKSGFYVYSLDQSNKKIVPGRVDAVFYSGLKNCLEITLDNGKTIRVSDNHKFILKSGRRIRANKLKIDDSLMPIYSVIEKRKFNSLGYENILHPSGEWQSTHRMVYDWKYGKDLSYHTTREQKLNTAHHKDFNSLNNDPSNICACKFTDHFSYHSKKTLSRNIIRNPAHFPGAMEKMVKTRKAHPLGYLQGKSVLSEEKRSIFSSRMKNNNPMWYKDVSSRKNRTRKATDLGFKSWEDLVKEVVEKSTATDLDLILKNMYLITKWKNWKSEILESWPSNHKIVSIKNIGVHPVYNLSVAVTHNYALDAGIFINNCWPPRPNDQASPDTYADNKKMHRVTDHWPIHCCLMDCHDANQATGSPTVYTNNKKQARIGDSISCGSHNAEGSNTVFADDGGGN